MKEITKKKEEEKKKNDDVIHVFSVSEDFLQSPLRSPAITDGRQKLVLYDVIGVTLTLNFVK